MILSFIWNKNPRQLKQFCKIKELSELSPSVRQKTTSRGKLSPYIMRKNIFINPIWERMMTSKVYKKLKMLDIKMRNSPIKAWVKDVKRDFSIKSLNGWKTSIAITEIKIKMSLQYHLLHARMDKKNKNIDSKFYFLTEYCMFLEK